MEQSIIQDCVRSRQPIPKHIKDAPILSEGESLFYVAFHELSTCRTYGFSGVGPIPFTAILQYCQMYDFDDELTGDTVYLIRCMDSAFLDYQEQLSKERSRQTKRAGRGR